jgi:hypothetical protein
MGRLTVGQGRGGHVYLDDELGKLADHVVARIHPNSSDREFIEDCLQTAYTAGLLAQHSAQRSQQRTSRHVLKLAMRQAVYRLLRHRSRKVYRESDLQLSV